MNIYFFITVFKIPTSRNEMPQAGIRGNFFLKSLPVKDFILLIYINLLFKNWLVTNRSDPRLSYFFAVPDESKVKFIVDTNRVRNSLSLTLYSPSWKSLAVFE